MALLADLLPSGLFTHQAFFLPMLWVLSWIVCLSIVLNRGPLRNPVRGMFSLFLPLICWQRDPRDRSFALLSSSLIQIALARRPAVLLSLALEDILFMMVPLTIVLRHGILSSRVPGKESMHAGERNRKTMQYLLSFLPLLACPLMMGGMMWLIMRGMRGGKEQIPATSAEISPRREGERRCVSRDRTPRPATPRPRQP